MQKANDRASTIHQLNPLRCDDESGTHPVRDSAAVEADSVSPVSINFIGGKHAIIEHSENVAFDPRQGSSSDFYVLTGSLRMFSTFDAVSSIAILSGSGTISGEA